MPQRFLSFRGIYARMFVVICAVAVPIVAGLIYFLNQQQQVLLEQARATAWRYVHLAARHEEWLFRNTEETLQVLARMPIVRSADWRACDAYLADLLSLPNTPYSNFGVISPDGRVLCNATRPAGGVMPYLGDRGYFQRALAAEGAVLGEYQMGRIIGIPAVAVALALRDEGGEPVAVLYATLRLTEIARAAELPDGLEAHDLTVMDREGVIVSQRPSRLGRVGDAVTDTDLLALLADGQQGLAQVVDGVDTEWLVAYAHAGLPADPAALQVIYRTPLSSVLGPIHRDLLRTGLAMLALVLLALGAGWAGTQAIVGRNVRHLTEAARRLRRREYDFQVQPWVSGQEFQEIAGQFDQMARDLQAYEAQWQATLQRQRGQAEILEHIAQSGRLDDTLHALLAFVEEQEGLAAALVQLAPDGRHVARCLAPGLPSAVVEAWSRMTVDDAGGACLVAIREHRVVVTNDVGTDPDWEAIRGLALSHGIRGAWAFPIFSPGGLVLGAIALVFAQARAPDPDLVQLGQTAADLAALAIERDRNRHALTQSEAEYRYLFEGNPNPMWVQDAENGQILAVNDQALQLYGYTRSEFLALSIQQLEVQQSGGRDATSLGFSAPEVEVVSTRSVRRHVRKDGSEVLVQSLASPLNFRGREARVLLIQDITEHTLLRQGIRERDELFTLLMESTVEAICGVDATGRCTFANLAFQQLLGYGEDELIGQTLHELIHARHENGRPYPLHECPVYQAIKHGNATRSDDEVFWRKDGSALPVEYWVYPLQRDGVAQGAIVTFLDITERRRQRDALHFRANHDALTGLVNRAGFTQAAEDTLRELAPRERLAVFLVDLDGFKEVNDSLGHQVGDELLTQVANRLPLVDPCQVAVARVGGDEFAVLFRLPADSSVPLSPEAALAQRAQQLLAQIRQPVRLGELELQISGSVGIACYPDHGRNLTELMRQADIAMYQAKRGGMGYAFSDPAQAQNNPSRLLLMTKMRQALERDEFVLYYQPKYELKQGRCVGFEALIRWQHPERGLLQPGVFMPVLELSDLIHPFTDWVLAAAVRQAAAWREAGRVSAVAVNISARNLLDSGLPDKVKSALQQYVLPAESLELEITESSIMADPVRSLDVLQRLHEIGVRIAIDDFGTGYSSLAYLQRLPVDTLKVDRSFVVELARRDEARKIVAAIVGLAHSLDVKVTAEGIENEEALALLRTMQCDEGQGFYLGKPLPAEQLTLVV